MFEALILVCMSTELKSCSIIEDTRGPYATLGRCMDRTTEMSAAMLTFDKNQLILGARCKPTEGVKRQFLET